MGANRAGGLTASCSFCGRSNTEVRTIVAGPGVFICDECTLLCQQVINETGPGVARVSRGSRTRTSIGGALGVTRQTAWERFATDT